MVFSEPTFIFFFLPFFTAAYLLFARWRNPLLLAASLLFYAWGEPAHLPVLSASIAMNYGIGLGIDAALRRGGSGRAMLALGVTANLCLLGWYKYLGFFLETAGVANAAQIAPELPVGISFFTFQALSYLIDLRAGRIGVQRSPQRLALYISMFPQLIAGPIVRYAEVETALAERRIRAEDIAIGMQRFVTGLAKKALIADPMGLTADRIFAIPDAGLAPGTAWIGALAYMLQIYFDFSAYSDMAIGLGRILGFRFPENFDHPYAARSVTGFWRRWHMTLSGWFRDYLYIPLGGNRRGPLRTYANLGIVFLATGIWHGAAWTFVLWGLWHGAFLVAERMAPARWRRAVPGPLARLGTLLAVLFGWVLFRADGTGQAAAFWSAMLGRTGPEAGFYPAASFFDAYILTVMAAGACLCVPVVPRLEAWLRPRLPGAGWVAGRTVMAWGLFSASIVSLGAASYSPFIYFRF
ncbi:MBOAT family protein [Poseidonocella sp. HB161398]|uniref:MBOAT family O-acyltransferase n=1 Tax=Poseidonocella sp. HB161398 TaxID=2320855 RepID=UPI001109ECBE|nr:MBOAT family O-acyltransferase [Poseidonocella sp. HB161398]